jgi:hypothetical protein
MRLVACLTVCVPVVALAAAALAAQTESQAPPAEPQAYCVNRGGGFYPYSGNLAKAAIN